MLGVDWKVVEIFPQPTSRLVNSSRIPDKVIMPQNSPRAGNRTAMAGSAARIPVLKQLLVFLSVASLGVAAQADAAETVRIGTQTFTLPDGFEIELVANSPLVDRPIGMAFDEQGRLYVSDSSGSNDKVQKQLEEKPHRIVRLEDTDGDGRFDKSAVFADRMMFPEGVMWLDGSLYVAAPPSIWKLTDTDNDGVADKREEWFKGHTLTNCANDLHGPYLGRDGWVYWCKGAFAEQTYDLAGRPGWKTRASHIFRARPDGTGFEPVMTGGMDNPVDVTFTPEGDRILSCTFFQLPSGGNRDGLIHAIYGGVYGKPNAVLDGHARTGDLMPVLSHLGPAAPAGLHHYDSRAFGPEWQGNLFTCLFNLRKVTRHVLERSGAALTTKDSDFVVSDSTDFHPTDVLEDADGSLLICDTGGWYKICCPTSQLHKPDVLGAIYRVRRKGMPRVEDPRGLKIAWKEASPDKLAALLGDERVAVRERALGEIGRRGAAMLDAVKSALQNSTDVATRRNAVWALTRVDAPSAREAIRAALRDADSSVVQAAAHSVALWKDAAAESNLIPLLSSHKPAVHRAAAEALGRIGASAEAAKILLAAASSKDRALEHSTIFALIELGHRDVLRTALNSSATATRKAALIALDQLNDPELTPEHIAGWFSSDDPELSATARWIASRHAAWGVKLAERILERPANQGLTAAEVEQAAELLALSASDPSTQQEIVKIGQNPRYGSKAREVMFRAMAKTRLKEMPAEWASALAQELSLRVSERIGGALDAVRALPAPPKAVVASLRDALVGVGSDVNIPVDLRLSALAALPAGARQVDDKIFEFVRTQLAPEAPLSRRSVAASFVVGARLTTPQRLALADSLKTAAASELPRLLAAFESSSDATLGHAIVAALGKNPARASLAPALIKPRLAKFPQPVQAELEIQRSG